VSGEEELKRRAYIGIGANQGDVKETALAAIDALRSIERCDFVAVSSFYQSAPVDAEGPDFINAVVALDTLHDPYALLLHLLDLEIMLGRKRRLPNSQRNAPRKVDLDLLLMGDLIVCSTPLTLPHPRLHQRAFALRPLVDLAPEIEIPGLGKAAKFLGAAMDQRVTPWPA
jgi:2-amino-4-hydroxy-6-hydroxymethyldihydropteridine diphosphokinase